MNRPITVHRRNTSHSRAIRRLIVDVIRDRDSAARSNNFEGLGEDGGAGGGSCVDFAGTLTGRLQWGHSTLRVLYSRQRGWSGCTKDNQRELPSSVFNHTAPCTVKRR